MATHPNHNMRVCAYPDIATSHKEYFHPTEVLAEMKTALQIDFSGTNLDAASSAAPGAPSISDAAPGID